MNAVTKPLLEQTLPLLRVAWHRLRGHVLRYAPDKTWPRRRCHATRIWRSPATWSGLAVWIPITSILLDFTGCGEKNVYKAPPPPAVTVSRPVRRTVTDYLELTGNTQAINTVQLTARVEGYLEKVLFKDGDRVKKGQLLFLIQQNTYQAQLQQAQANIMSQQANLEHAQTEFVRYSNLVKQNAAAQTDVDQWQYQRDAAQAALVSARAAKDLAQLNLDYTRVTAPFDGRTDRHLVDPGNLVGAGQNTVLAAINQIDPIYAYFTINERDLLHAMGHTRIAPQQVGRENMPVYMGLTNESDYPHVGRLDFAAISVTPTTGTLLLRGIFPNPKGMVLPGLFARIRLPIQKDFSALLVPEAALGFDQLGDFVLVVNAQNVVERRTVTLGSVIGTDRVIETGLTGDEWVVTDGLLRAIPGRPVTPQRAMPTTQTNPASHPATQNAPVGLFSESGWHGIVFEAMSSLELTSCGSRGFFKNPRFSPGQDMASKTMHSQPESWIEYWPTRSDAL